MSKFHALVQANDSISIEEKHVRDTSIQYTESERGANFGIDLIKIKHKHI